VTDVERVASSTSWRHDVSDAN